MTYPIKSAETVTNKTPTEGKWYCGFEVVSDPKNGFSWHRDGALAQFVDGEFVDEEGEPVGMGDYDYLVEQV